jgi:hypothetical protein
MLERKRTLKNQQFIASYDLAFLSILSPLYSCRDQYYILFVGTFRLRLCEYAAQVAQSWIVAGMSYLT